MKTIFKYYIINDIIKEFLNTEPDLGKAYSINTKINKIYKIIVDHPLPHSITIDHFPNNFNENEIKITLDIKDNEVNKKIYFLCNNKKSNKVPNYINELNSENTELFIESSKQNYQQYFIPSKKGKYDIILKFKKYFKNCSYMFYSCKQIIRVDFSNFKTKEVTDMSHLFHSCIKLKELNLSNLNTENVKNMSNMFSKCTKLSIFNTSSFNIENVNNMEEMFLNCRNLKNIDFSSTIASHNLKKTNIFEGCWNFEKLKLNKLSKEKFKNEKLNIEYV